MRKRLKEEKVLELLRREGVLTPRGILKRLGLGKQYRHALRKMLGEMVRRGEVVRAGRERFAVPEAFRVVKGKIQRFGEGFGFLLMPEGPDVFIPPHKMRGAMSGDVALVRIVRERRGGRPEGEVLKVLERGRVFYTGTFHGTRRFGLVEPDETSLPPEIPVPKGWADGARDGDKVVFRVVGRRRALQARIVEVLGRADDPKVDLLVVLRKFELPESFPPEVEAQAEKLRSLPFPPSGKKRLDLRDQLIFTIDPWDAKDFDDAISIERTPVGYRLGVHIADVSFYVRHGDPIDREALDRGTSVYLIDTVVPMLPHTLSSDLCSLKPGEDRLTFSVLFELDLEGRPVRVRIRPSVIRSRARLTYEDAQALIDGGEPDPEGPTVFLGKKTKEAVRQALRTALELAKKLRHRRWERGSLDFDLPEPYIEVTPGGEVTDIRVVERTWSHRIIEEFMILANEAVARFLSERDIPTLYRVHEPPDPRKVREFLELAEAVLGIELPQPEKVTPKTLQRVLEAAQGREEEKLLNYLLLRSLMRARYSVENVGHFGLASPMYLHFTSPIRRYPDLVVHRITKKALRGKARRDPQWVEYLERVAAHATAMEQRAEEAEFELIDLKKMEFMKDHIGEEFSGIITHITPNGFFVELQPYLVEGFVSVDTLKGRFRFLQKTYQMVDERSGQSFRIGQKVRAKVVRVDKFRKRLDLLLTEAFPN